MKFILHYRGPLRSNGSPQHKHELRQAFHSQLQQLWLQPPLNEERTLLKPRDKNGDYSLLRHVAPFMFVPLVTAEMNGVAELRVTILRPESPGNLITQGGDIDNRLKTLFDALTMPRHTNALPTNETPTEDQKPFYCLLEDDNLVTSVSVRTEQLLAPPVDRSHVEVLIAVETAVTRQTIDNVVLR
jgi:hypothetical protein